jgi:hypothetical protein
VLADGVVVGRIFKVRVGGRTPWMWTLALGHHDDRAPTHGYEATREAAMAAFAKTWRRGCKGLEGLSMSSSVLAYVILFMGFVTFLSGAPPPNRRFRD